MEAIFSTLGLGISFDKRRFKKEVDLFEKPQGDAREAPLAQADAPAAAADDVTAEPARKRKKRKLRHGAAAEADEAGAGGIALFGSGAGAAPGSGPSAASAPAAAANGGPAAASRDPFEEANVLRKAHRIKVAGSAPPAPLRGFAELESGAHGAAPRRLLRNLAESGFAEPTPIQRQATPALLAGRELLAIAPTGEGGRAQGRRSGRRALTSPASGSGKTLAFLLPLIAHAKRLQAEAEAAAAAAAGATAAAGGEPPAPEGPPTRRGGPKVVVVSPTKELATQTARVAKLLLPGLRLRASLLSKATAAGTDFGRVDLLLANPLRLGAMADEGGLDLSQARRSFAGLVRYLILDEADKLFDMGFTEQIDAVIAACSHPDCVRGLFSATLPEQVEALARSVLKDPLRVTVGERNTAAATVAQRLLFVGREAGKLLALRQAIAGGLRPPVLVFVATKERAKELHRELLYDGVHVDSIHANQSQATRQAAVDNFRAGRTWVLVATDLIGRGMDFLGVNTVINYDFPQANVAGSGLINTMWQACAWEHSTTDYIHRVGRTGRAGRAGEAITFFTEDDSGKLRGVANVMRAAGCDVPEWMLALKKEPRRRRGHRTPQTRLQAQRRLQRQGLSVRPCAAATQTSQTPASSMSSTQPTSVIGLVGLAVMGQNLALNVAEKGFSISVYNRSGEKTDAAVARAGKEGVGARLHGFHDLKDFVQSLERPRRIIILVKAGKPVDSTIEQLTAYLEPGDIIIDGGNEWYENTERRQRLLADKGIFHIGMGVSGGEEGARNGPAMMPGGDLEAYKHLQARAGAGERQRLRAIVEKVAAQTDDGACVTYVGPGGSGNYVKMVHNGIEYGDMQLIAEAYDVLRVVGGLSNEELADVFAEWNKGEASGRGRGRARVLPGGDHLPHLQKARRAGRRLADRQGEDLLWVLDKTGMKGTGKWTIQQAAELAVAAPTMEAALDARFLSGLKEERLAAEEVYRGMGVEPPSAAAAGNVDKAQLIADVRAALYASKICSYAQGYNIIRAKSGEQGWGVDLGGLARIWKGGCIIRAGFLDRIKQAYQRNPDLPNLLVDSEFAKDLAERRVGGVVCWLQLAGAVGQDAWRRVVQLAVGAGIGVPGITASLAYFDSYRRGRLPANLVQARCSASSLSAQRDFFGSHTYERTDGKAGWFHTVWDAAYGSADSITTSGYNQ
eukprot:scaffold5.g722.t1